MNHDTQSRIVAVSLSTNGFGFAAMEGSRLIDYGNKVFLRDKSANSLAQMAKLIARFRPDRLVLYDIEAKGTHRHPRIKQLHGDVVALARNRKLKTATMSKGKVKAMLLNEATGSKHDVACRVAEQYPVLAHRLPPKRKYWKTEAARMDMFEAVALAMGWLKRSDSV